MKFKEKTVENLVSLLHLGSTIGDACKKCGISRKTFYEWYNTNSVFKEKIIEVQESVVDNVESALYKAALEGNVTAQIFMLKTKGKSRGYVEGHELVIPSNVEIKVYKSGEAPVTSEDDLPE